MKLIFTKKKSPLKINLRADLEKNNRGLQRHVWGGEIILFFKIDL
jgi:hypothetical protein